MSVVSRSTRSVVRWFAGVVFVLSIPSGSAAAADWPDDSKLEPDAEAVSVLKQIEGGFGVAVEWIDAVLFYRVAAGERNYIVTQPSVLYLRPEGSDDPFDRIGGTETDLPDALARDRISVLAARDRAVAVGTDNKPVGKGTYGDQRVEFARIIPEDLPPGVAYGKKFVPVETADGTVYRRVEQRDRLSEEFTLTPDFVQEYAERGWLATADNDGETWNRSESTGGFPVIVLWLSLGGILFTIYMGFYNVRGFKHAIDIVRGKYDNPDDEGEVTHFQALASALSATVGLGNIAGVTIAMTLGGPGAFFWMLLCGAFGMTSKFVECTLGQKYRHVSADGHVQGGPMRYLRAGLAELKLGPLGVVLSLVFSVMCVLASFGGGNMFQANQSGNALVVSLQAEDREALQTLDTNIADAAERDDTETMVTLQKDRQALAADMDSFDRRFRIGYGLLLATLVAFVIIGGIKRIGAAAEKIVPTMCLLYVGMCAWIIAMHLDRVPDLIASIFTEAFTGTAMGGGIVGVAILGIQRAAFSNEAGVGSAAIAHSAAKTDEPVREGSVALLGPFIDTIIVCSMTALVILITGAWDNTAWTVDSGLEGSGLMTRALEDESPLTPKLFPWVLSGSTVLFAFSTIVSWSYYGERAWEELFGRSRTIFYKFLAVFCVFAGAVFSLGKVLDFSDYMILAMAFPNILGALLLAPKVKRDLKAYWDRYQAGEFKTYR